MDEETGDYILNGNYMVTVFHKSLKFGEIALDYTGSHAIVERINSSRPIEKNLILEVI